MVIRYAVIEGGKVKNLALADAAYASEHGWVEASPPADIGWSYDGVDFTPPTPDLTALAAAARSDRNALLAATDWMALSDVTMSPEWATYRQALRDLPDQVGFPENVTWPVKPE